MHQISILKFFCVIGTLHIFSDWKFSFVLVWDILKPSFDVLYILWFVDLTKLLLEGNTLQLVWLICLINWFSLINSYYSWCLYCLNCSWIYDITLRSFDTSFIFLALFFNSWELLVFCLDLISLRLFDSSKLWNNWIVYSLEKSSSSLSLSEPPSDL